MHCRKEFVELESRLKEPRKWIQVLLGPRQVGKIGTLETLKKLKKAGLQSEYVVADQPTLKDRDWLVEQWSLARKRCENVDSFLLVIDEIQKIDQWSETLKSLWDEDTRKNIPLKVLLLGSSRILIQKGLTESLAGRFELIRVGHKS